MPDAESNGHVTDGEQKRKPSERALSNWQRLSYGVGHVLNDLTASMWFSYLLVFLHQVVNFNNVLAGYLVLIGQIADAVCTPFVGLESDRTREGFWNLGKRKSWHFVGTLCVLASFPFIFQLCITCEDSPNIAQFIYFAPFVVIFQFGWASTQISHLSYSSELTPYKQERVALQSIRNFFTIFANLSVYGIFTLLFQFESDGKSETTSTGNSSVIDDNPTDDLTSADAPKFRYDLTLSLVAAYISKMISAEYNFNAPTSIMNLMFICMGIGVLFNIIFYVGTSGVENKGCSKTRQKNAVQNGTTGPDDEESLSTIELSTLRHSQMLWKDWLKEHQFYQIAVLYMATRLYININQVYLSMYLTETIQLSKIYIAILPLFTNSSSFLTSILAPFVNKLLGRKMAYFVGVLFGAGASVWLYLIEKHSQQIYGGVILLGVAGSLLLITSLSMTSDLIGSNTESGAFVFGAMSFTDKLSNGVAILIIQKFHPCVNCCPACDPFYRHVQTIVPGAALVVAFLILLTLVPQNIGARKGKPKTEAMRPKAVCTDNGGNVVQCSCGEFYTPPGSCVYCVVEPSSGVVTHFPQIHDINHGTTPASSDEENESQPLLSSGRSNNSPVNHFSC